MESMRRIKKMHALLALCLFVLAIHLLFGFVWLPTAKSMFRSLHSCLEGCDQKDPTLVKLIKKEFLQSPSSLPYNFDQKPPNVSGEVGQPDYVDKLLAHRRNGFFVECGAHDGEAHSNSLLFELERNWTGLLVEADPDSFRLLLGKQRKAHMLNACLSVTNRSERRQYLSAGIYGGLVGVKPPDYIGDFREEMKKKHQTKNITVQCFPLFSALLALAKALA